MHGCLISEIENCQTIFRTYAWTKFFQQSLHICFASEATYFPSITIHLSSNVFHWGLETKLVHEYVEYGIDNQGNADAGNTEY